MSPARYEMKDSSIRIEDVGVRYGDTPVLAGVSAEVRDIVRPGCITGQIIGILGPRASARRSWRAC